MLDLRRDINSLSEFKRNTPRFIQQMKETGEPVVLTVNGRAEIVVQDAESYQRLLAEVDRLHAIEGIKRGLKDVEEGRTLPLATFDAEMRAKHGITREAQTEVTEIFVWKGENQSVETASEWYNGIMDALYSLEEMPGRCALAQENDDFEKEIRQLLYGKRKDTYRVLFTIHGETVYILHVLHSAMARLKPDP